ncbi:hypothetical protein MAPG_08619 [Magnaporthiopsis poae ATCC 64411]|uniref:Uncharacterized protein n=1 Tax=Magnaporthiopsis poae (strain ATCC 64411 / 73-15) TaxID=644358 RepID=A0A0C4E7U4_MAGP6|nr:hypothetical protein MAPG_08619 [Magnaporthiopsis poae ATCC 64411]
MVTLSWGTIKSLLIVFGPFFLPKILSLYRRVRYARNQPGAQPIRPLPPGALRALVLLAAVSIAFLVKSLPIPGLTPENVFVLTDSRLQIPTDVLFNRLASLRPDGVLTARDESLRVRFVNLESRLLYLTFGPAALADCAFCNSDEPNSYLVYALVDVLAPHLLNVALLTLATSKNLSGGGWRGRALLASAVLTAIDLGAAAIVKNTVSRDAELMRTAQAYWAHETAVMGATLEDREVVDGIRDALESRIDMGAISADAERYVNAMLESSGE